ncbi:MAG: PilZ domain-containing protein [Planctomycetota bacterium]
MLEGVNGQAAKKLALVLVRPSNLKEVCQRLTGEGWSQSIITSPDDLVSRNPDTVDCLLLDLSRKLAADAVLAWCERSSRWRRVPKLLITPVGRPAAPRTVPGSKTDGQLDPALKTVQALFDGHWAETPGERRRQYRQECHSSATVRLRETAILLDVSSGGASLELPHGVPPGARITLPVSESPPALTALDAQVLSCHQQADPARFLVHVMFLGLSPGVERALQRRLLLWQTRRVEGEVAKERSGRRHDYRHRCARPAAIQVQLTAGVLDISAGGAALELDHALPQGTQLSVPVLDTDPLLKALDAEVLSSNRSNQNCFCVHVRFTNVSPEVGQALGEFILDLKAARKGSSGT